MARILIVDDDEDDRALMQAVLSRDGHVIHIAVDGAEALASFRDVAIDVVVTDLQMPNVHGLELISVLRDVLPRPAIVAVSGTGEPQLDVADAVGADVAIAKPLTHAALLRGVRDALAAVKARVDADE